MAEQDWKANKRVFAAVSVPTLLWTLLFFVIPMAIVWFYSFGENRGLTEIEFSGTLENYKRATEFLYLSIFGKSFAVAALVTLICLIVGFPVAMAITFASEKWRPWLLLGIMLPFWTNLLIRTYALMMLLGTQGFANKGLGALWDGASWLKTLVGMQPLPTWEPVQLLFNNFAVVFGLVYVHLPFMVLPLYASLEKIDGRLVEAAADLYSSPFTAFRTVTLPLSMPGLVAGTLLTFIPAAGDYINAELLGNPTTRMVGNEIQDLFAAGDYPTASSLSVTLMAAIVVLVFVYVRRAGTEELV